MIQKGKIVKSDSGRRICVDRFIKAGGQGEAYATTEVNSGQKGLLKVFHKRFANRDTVKRLRFLVAQKLQSACAVICAPIEVLKQRNLVGHYAPFAPGQSLEDFLAKPTNTFIEGVQLAITLAHAVQEMHKRQIAHGDLRADNLIINHTGSVFRLHIIDLDNFNAPGVPAPAMIGQDLYLAPELHWALKNKKPAIPNIYTDRFAMAVLMHEILLLRHVAAGADDNETDFQKAMCAGRWIQDPASSDRPNGNLGGYPVEVLNADLARLFRAALSRDPAKRPSADVWETELCKAFKAVYPCPRCDGSSVIDVSRVSCPACRVPFPTMTLRVCRNGRAFPLAAGARVVGRAEVGGSMKVSARHAIFRRVGPETWLESTGSNGTYRWNGSGWTKLPDRESVLVQKNDRLRLADVEVELN